MTRADKYVNHMYSRYAGRAAVTVGVNSDSETIHPFVYENVRHRPIGLIAMSATGLSDPAEVDIYHISSFNPGKGQGTEIMRFLCEAADNFNVRLCIQAQAQPSGNQTLAGDGLVSWYRKYGFKGDSTMQRDPAFRQELPVNAIAI